MSLTLVRSTFEDFETDADIKLCFLDPPDNEGRAYENYKDDLPDHEYKFWLRDWIEAACGMTNGPVFISFAEKWIPEVEKIIVDSPILLVQRISYMVDY